MIYLFDDKKNRQTDAGWEEQRLNQFSDIIKPIYFYSEIEVESKRREVFSKGSVVLFHESFFDNVLNRHHKDGLEIRNKLNEFSSENKDFLLVFFSGSKNTRNLTENVGHIPVSVLYQNLETFSNNARNGDINLRYLLFGKNHKVEEVLLRELNNANSRIEDSIENGCPVSLNFIAVTQMGEIEMPFENADCETFFTDDITDDYNSDIDKYSTDIITKWLSLKEYDNIFIPISFGSTLSDFNGLRFATHIRCSDTPNRLKNIFLYSFVGYEYLVANEYFDILKTKNVFLIDHKKSAFANAVNLSSEPLTLEELPKELKKILIEPPKNYEDSHSIANEWAIFRWASSINSFDNEIEQIIKRVNNQLYFKYLRSIYPIEEIKTIPEKELKIVYTGNPKILYIDDEAEKGWYEVFCKVLYDINGLNFEYLDEEFNSKTQDEIIKISIDKISKEDIDLVILDFRLHPNDFNANNIREVTGQKLLKEIKNLNPGIQVIVFSATNKVWNLQALLDAGADGFILKESPELSVSKDYSKESLGKFTKTVEHLLKYSFIKSIFASSIKISLELIEKKKKKELPKEFVDEILRWIELSNYNILKNKNEFGLTSSFLLYFSILENLSNRLINVESPIAYYDEANGKTLYVFEFRISSQKLHNFHEDPLTPNLYRKAKKAGKFARILPWRIKILNAFDFIMEYNIDENLISSLVRKRNDIIHANTTTGNKIKIEISEIITLFDLIIKGLRKIK
jgi:CheY-like chemotaxis protein